MIKVPSVTVQYKLSQGFSLEFSCTHLLGAICPETRGTHLSSINCYEHLSTTNPKSQDRSTYTGWWCGTFLFFHSVGNVIIPIDELIFFRGVGQPPTSISTYINIYHLQIPRFVDSLIQCQVVGPRRLRRTWQRVPTPCRRQWRRSRVAIASTAAA